MKKNKVRIGGVYVAKVTNRLVEVRIDGTNRHGGWNATNIRTGRNIRIKSAQRLRSEVKKMTKVESREATEAPATSDAKSEIASKTAGKKVKTKETKVTKGEKKPKRVSALDTAAQVLAKAGKPMRARELVAAMADQGLWKSPAGATPHATLYAGMMRESRDKGTASRFRKVDRGLFAFNKAGA